MGAGTQWMQALTGGAVAETSPPEPDADEHEVYLSWLDTGLASLVLCVCGLMSLKLDLGIHKQLLIAALRMVGQLTLLGYILVPIFTLERFYVVLVFLAVMIGVATLEAASRSPTTYPGMMQNTLLAMAGSASAMLTYTILVVLRLHPWWEPQYVIPVFGMLLGNTTSAISVGLNTTLDDLSQNRSVIEGLLALGATRFEATEATVRRAIRTALLPLLNQMSVMGLVSIPGMMTGQILGGTEPSQAARYQMVILFLIAGSTSIAACATVYMAVLSVVDDTHTFRTDRLRRKAPLREHVRHASAQVRRTVARWRAARSGRWGGYVAVSNGTNGGASRAGGSGRAGRAPARGGWAWLPAGAANAASSVGGFLRGAAANPHSYFRRQAANTPSSAAAAVGTGGGGGVYGSYSAAGSMAGGSALLGGGPDSPHSSNSYADPMEAGENDSLLGGGGAFSPTSTVGETHVHGRQRF